MYITWYGFYLKEGVRRPRFFSSFKNQEFFSRIFLIMAIAKISKFSWSNGQKFDRGKNPNFLCYGLKV